MSVWADALREHAGERDAHYPRRFKCLCGMVLDTEPDGTAGRCDFCDDATIARRA